MLEILHPALPDCETCQKYQYDFEKGQIERAANGAYRERVLLCPCRTKKGCPKGTPEAPRTLWKNNRQAYEFYLECEAVGHFPDDPYVRWIARVIRETKQRAEKILARREQEATSELSLFKVLSHVAATRHPPNAPKR